MTVYPNEEDYWPSQGQIACERLEHTLEEILCNVDSSNSAYFLYLQVLAHNVGELGWGDGRDKLLPRQPCYWVDLAYSEDRGTTQRNSKPYAEATVEQELIESISCGDTHTIHSLRTVQIRTSHGWVKDDDDA